VYRIAILLLMAAAAVVVHPAIAANGTETVFPLIEPTNECRDIRGMQVMTLNFERLGDVGRATLIRGVPTIIMNPLRLATLPPKLQTFFYAHECGHHVLGHALHPMASSENEADCWAIKTGRDRGLFARQDIEGFAPWLAASRGTLAGHLPGPERLRHLLACFDER
jgi:hypothetical protein